MTISEIESMSYAEAEVKAIEKTIVKGHTVFFVDFGGTFGYSALVFKNNRHIHYANEYQLHHGYIVEEHGKEHLRGYYMELLRHKLFFDEELLEDVTSYDEYRRKLHFIVNYYLMRYDQKSAFNTTGKDANALGYVAYSPVSACYVKSPSIVKTQLSYYTHIRNELMKLRDNPDTFREMIRYELANHEAVVTGKYDDALTSLNLTYEELSASQSAILHDEMDKLSSNDY